MTLEEPRGDESDEEADARLGIASVTEGKKMEDEEESPLRAIFGNTPQTRMIETLVLHSDCDYDLYELAEISEAPDMVAMMSHKALLMDYQIMKETVIKNNVQRYALDKDSPTGKLLNDLAFKLADTHITLKAKG
jgi:hypothetical protein